MHTRSSSSGFRERLREGSRSADLVRAVLLYLVSRLGISIFLWLTGQHYNCGNAGCVDRGFFPDNFLLNGLFQWDALQYRRLIRDGYYLGHEYDTTAPFFPGFPLAAWVVGRLFGSSNWGGIALNQAASIGAAYGMARLCRRLAIGEEDTKRDVPSEASLFWLASPLTLFFCVFLSESLFGFLSVVTLWSVAAGAWPLALVAGVWVTATRNAGVIVALSAALLAWERRHEVKVSGRGWFCIACMPLGLLALCLHQHLVLDNAFAWVDVQIRWNRFLTTPWRTIRDDWKGWPGVTVRNVRAMYPVQELLALALPAPLLALRRRFNIPWAILFLGIAEWLLPLLSHSLMSSARYQAGNIYFALAIPALLTGRPMLRGVSYMLFGMVLAWYVSTYPLGVWAS